ncbi:MAG: chemotaxis protein CheR [Methanosarcinales archaeon]|jgi:chemotaxis protein methyltransferase CheR|nr:chemotaxis protein CheR [Methanosarcinales archaeon]
MAFTYFFRDMQTLDMIRDYVIPEMRSRRYIHIWDAGCAMGPEPYSLAIVLRENMGPMIFRNVQIAATDIDGSNLFGKIIEDGIYQWDQVGRIPKEIMNTYFTPTGPTGEYRIIDEIRRSVKYQQHNLLSFESVQKDAMLIVCKNVLLHFTEQERAKVVKMYYDSLVDGGFFVTEQTQKMPKEMEKLFEPVVANARVYRKVS